MTPPEPKRPVLLIGDGSLAELVSARLAAEGLDAQVVLDPSVPAGRIYVDASRPNHVLLPDRNVAVERLTKTPNDLPPIEALLRPLQQISEPLRGSAPTPNRRARRAAARRRS